MIKKGSGEVRLSPKPKGKYFNKQIPNSLMANCTCLPYLPTGRHRQGLKI